MVENSTLTQSSKLFSKWRGKNLFTQKKARNISINPWNGYKNTNTAMQGHNCKAANFPWIRGPNYNSWRYSRSILRSIKTIRIWITSSKKQLFIFRRLCRSRQTKHRDYLPPHGLQNQISWEFLYFKRKPRIWNCKQTLRLLWWMY